MHLLYKYTVLKLRHLRIFLPVLNQGSPSPQWACLTALLLICLTSCEVPDYANRKNMVHLVTNLIYIRYFLEIFVKKYISMKTSGLKNCILRYTWRQECVLNEKWSAFKNILWNKRVHVWFFVKSTNRSSECLGDKYVKYYITLNWWQSDMKSIIALHISFLLPNAY